MINSVKNRSVQCPKSVEQIKYYQKVKSKNRLMTYNVWSSGDIQEKVIFSNIA